MEESIELQDIGDGRQRIMLCKDDGLRLQELIGNDIFVWYVFVHFFF